MTASDRTFIRAFAQTAISPSEQADGASPSVLTVAARTPASPQARLAGPHAQFGGIDPARSAENSSVLSDRPRPHVQFPSTIQIDGNHRRHTRIELDEGQRQADLRPLSHFSASAVALPFRPAYEVDRFAWPPICGEVLEAAAGSLDPLIERAIVDAEHGRSVVAVFGETMGTGCTTASLCVANRLATWGARVALVDATFQSPALAETLGVDIRAGWDNVLRGELPLAEAVIASKEDGIALLPLFQPIEAQGQMDLVCGAGAAEGIDTLRSHYDVTILDAGAPLLAQFAQRLGIGSAILVRTNLDISQDDSFAAAEEHLSTAGMSLLGVIENFADVAQHDLPTARRAALAGS